MYIYKVKQNIMDINTKINYRSWVIENLLLNKWSLKDIEQAKRRMFTCEELKGWAKMHLSSDFKYGRMKYFKKHLLNKSRINEAKKRGFNYLGQQIGFGKDVIVK